MFFLFVCPFHTYISSMYMSSPYVCLFIYMFLTCICPLCKYFPFIFFSLYIFPPYVNPFYIHICLFHVCVFLFVYYMCIFPSFVSIFVYMFFLYMYSPFVAPAWLGASVAAQVAASLLEWLGGSRGTRVACCGSWRRRIPRAGIGTVFLRVRLIRTSSFLFYFPSSCRDSVFVKVDQLVTN